VPVVGHADEGEYAPGTAKCGLAEVFLKPIPVDVITHDLQADVATGHKVLDSTRVLQA
jgi:hypothetical protein